MADPRTKETRSQHEFDAVVDDYLNRGYEAVDRDDRSAMMRKPGWGCVEGHLVVLSLTFWWTAGLGNLAYALIARYTEVDEVLVRLEDQRRRLTDDGPPRLPA